MNIGDALLPVLVVGQATANDGASAFAGGLMTYGPLGLWVVYMLWRDNRDSAKQDKRHDDNLAAQKAVEQAIRTNTNSILAAMAGVRHLDSSYAEMLDRIQEDNTPKA